MPRRRFWRVDKGIRSVGYKLISTQMYDMLDDKFETPDSITSQDAKFKSGYICCYKTPSGRATLVLHITVLTCRPNPHPRRHGPAAFDQ